jgi:hypothetical protein
MSYDSEKALSSTNHSILSAPHPPLSISDQMQHWFAQFNPQQDVGGGRGQLGPTASNKLIKGFSYFYTLEWDRMCSYTVATCTEYSTFIFTHEIKTTPVLMLVVGDPYRHSRWKPKFGDNSNHVSQCSELGVTKRRRLSWLTNSGLMSGEKGEGGSCAVSANDYSPNKLWRSN